MGPIKDSLDGQANMQQYLIAAEDNENPDQFEKRLARLTKGKGQARRGKAPQQPKQSSAGDATDIAKSGRYVVLCHLLPGHQRHFMCKA